MKLKKKILMLLQLTNKEIITFTNDIVDKLNLAYPEIQFPDDLNNTICDIITEKNSVILNGCDLK
jgi:hypothetical protein